MHVVQQSHLTLSVPLHTDIGPCRASLVVLSLLLRLLSNHYSTTPHTLFYPFTSLRVSSREQRPCDRSFRTILTVLSAVRA